MLSFQQFLALIIIAFLISRLIKQKNKKQLGKNEFYLWLFFWTGSALAIIFLKSFDRLAAMLGFSSSGINILIYGAILILFYFIFKMRLTLAKIDRDLSELNKEITLLKKE